MDVIQQARDEIAAERRRALVDAEKERIRKMQSPDLERIRRSNAVRDLSKPLQQQNFHAQIMSIAA